MGARLKENVGPVLTGGRIAAPKPRRLLVLVVDDDATMRSLLRSALNTLGYESRLAGSGEQARRELRSLRPMSFSWISD